MSSTEAKYYVLSSVAKEAAWIQHFLLEISYFRPDIKPILVNGDNQGSLALAENPQYHQKTKYINIQYHYIR